MIREKMKNRKGETLVETLVAVLICCLAMAALSAIMVSAGNTMHTTEEKFEAYYARDSVLACPGDESGTAGTVVILVDGASFKLSPEADNSGIPVEYYVNNEAGQKHIVKAYYADKNGNSEGAGHA